MDQGQERVNIIKPVIKMSPTIVVFNYELQIVLSVS